MARGTLESIFSTSWKGKSLDLWATATQTTLKRLNWSCTWIEFCTSLKNLESYYGESFLLLILPPKLRHQLSNYMKSHGSKCLYFHLLSEEVFKYTCLLKTCCWSGYVLLTSSGKKPAIVAIPRDPKTVFDTQSLQAVCKRHVGFNRIMKTRNKQRWWRKEKDIIFLMRFL